MKTLIDPGGVLAAGLMAIRTQYKVPAAFPDAVLAAAAQAAKRAPTEHRDRTDEPFVTLDPASSTDLDQAFSIEASGADLLLHYAIADVGWFVDEGGVIDAEAWRRGTTQYLPDGKAGLYPPCLSEAAASLLPDGPRPAVVFTVRVAPDGSVRLDGVERAIIRSRAKLAYDQVRGADLPKDFADLAARIAQAEKARGASRVDPPEQEVALGGDGHYQLLFRPRLASEDHNAALSLATNMAVADALLAHKTGLFRVMAAPDARTIDRLRHTARSYGINFPRETALADFARTLNADDPKQAALMLAIRRAGKGASYAPYRAGETPWHAAVAASYAHATAPLRRLADRYVVLAALAIAGGRPVPASVSEAFARLPDVMARANAQGSQIERAVVDLAEAVLLKGQEGQVFNAVITDRDERGARLQLCDWPVVTRADAGSAVPGERVRLTLVSVDPAQRLASFRVVAGVAKSA